MTETPAQMVDRCWWRAAARRRAEEPDADEVPVGYKALLVEVVTELRAEMARRQVVAFEAGRYGPQLGN